MSFLSDVLFQVISHRSKKLLKKLKCKSFTVSLGAYGSFTPKYAAGLYYAQSESCVVQSIIVLKICTSGPVAIIRRLHLRCESLGMLLGWANSENNSRHRGGSNCSESRSFWASRPRKFTAALPRDVKDAHGSQFIVGEAHAEIPTADINSFEDLQRTFFTVDMLRPEGQIYEPHRNILEI